jgi:hypothetical protein
MNLTKRGNLDGLFSPGTEADGSKEGRESLVQRRTTPAFILWPLLYG